MPMLQLSALFFYPLGWVLSGYQKTFLRKGPSLTQDMTREGIGQDERAKIDPTAQINVIPSRVIEAPSLVLGKQAIIRSGCAIYRGSTIGNRLNAGHHVIIREQNTIGHDFSVWSHSVIDYSCEIGDRVKIHAGVYIAQYSIIGDDAFIAPGVVFTNDLVPGEELSANSLGGPQVGKAAQIGARSVLLPNVKIGDDALVGAGSVVTRNVPAGMVVAGNPAKVIGYIADLRDRLAREGVWMPKDLC